MLPLSPLQLKHYCFTTIALRAVYKGTDKGEPTLEPSVECKPDKELPNHWRLALTLQLRSASADKPFLYEGDFQVVGLVEVAESFPPDKREQLARVNGLSLLYSAVREMVLNLSTRCARGRLCLPVLNFTELLTTSTPEPSRAAPKTHAAKPKAAVTA